MGLQILTVLITNQGSVKGSTRHLRTSMQPLMLFLAFCQSLVWRPCVWAELLLSGKSATELHFKLLSFWMAQVAPFRSEDMYSRMLQEVFSSAFCESSALVAQPGGALVHWQTQQVRRLFDVAAHPRLWPGCAAPKDEACELTKWLSYKTHAIRNCWKRNFNMLLFHALFER